jgi:1-acyl-sn-glycerol-3-phosphate acyltransferase
LTESFARRWRRRLLTIPGVVLGLGLVTLGLPLLLVAALGADLVRPAGRRTLASVRLALFLEAFLFIEAACLALLGAIWLVTLGSAARRAALTWPAQRLYTATLMRAAAALFALRFEIEGEDLASGGGPVLVLVRHASIVDVLVPGVFIANRHRLRLRYVLKRELLAAPCLDVAGHFLPNWFVARDGADTRREIEAIRALKTGLGPEDGVLIYPEGTRFSRQKRLRALERLAGDPDALARAERLRHLLPLRPGGSLALLEAPPACDVLFVGHSGLEGFASIADIWAGALVGKTLRVRFWRARAAEIPEGREARLAFLQAGWQRMDDWLSSLDEREEVALA